MTWRDGNFSIAGAAIQFLSSPSTASAETVYIPTPQEAFIIDLRTTLAFLQGQYGNISATRFHDSEELTHIQEDFVRRGYLRARCFFSNFISGVSAKYDWSENLSEEDLDYINGALRTEERVRQLDLGLEADGQSREYSPGGE